MTTLVQIHHGSDMGCFRSAVQAAQHFKYSVHRHLVTARCHTQGLAVHVRLLHGDHDMAAR